jgi:hypothetical protein
MRPRRGVLESSDMEQKKLLQRSASLEIPRLPGLWATSAGLVLAETKKRHFTIGWNASHGLNRRNLDPPTQILGGEPQFLHYLAVQEPAMSMVTS